MSTSTLACGARTGLGALLVASNVRPSAVRTDTTIAPFAGPSPLFMIVATKEVPTICALATMRSGSKAGGLGVAEAGAGVVLLEDGTGVRCVRYAALVGAAITTGGSAVATASVLGSPVTSSIPAATHPCSEEVGGNTMSNQAAEVLRPITSTLWSRPSVPSTGVSLPGAVRTAAIVFVRAVTPRERTVLLVATALGVDALSAAGTLAGSEGTTNVSTPVAMPRVATTPAPAHMTGCLSTERAEPGRESEFIVNRGT